jgi:hypothetical protein
MDELEALLRQFQPRRPRPLPDVERSRRFRPHVWIALSGLAAAGVLMVVRYQRTPVVDSPDTIAITLGALNTYAVKSLDDLDQALTKTSAAILPNVERSGGALHALSKP